MKILILGLLFLLVGCGEVTPTGGTSSTQSEKVSDSFLQFTSEGVSIYFDSTDPALTTQITKAGAIQVTGIPTSGKISCSNPSGTFFVWDDGTPDSRTMANSFCKASKFS